MNFLKILTLPKNKRDHFNKNIFVTTQVIINPKREPFGKLKNIEIVAQFQKKFWSRSHNITLLEYSCPSLS